MRCYAARSPAPGSALPAGRRVRTIIYLIDTMACDTQGTQKQLLETIRRLDRAAWSPHLVCLWESPWMRTAKLPCPVHVLGHTGFLKPGFPGVVRNLRRLYRDLGADLVHILFDEAIFVGWLAAGPVGRRPVLVSSRRDMGLGAANQPWYHRLFPMLLPVANLRFAGILANAAMIRTWAARRERTPLARYKVIRNGVDLPPPPPPRAEEPAGGVSVAIVASLTPVKRHDLLLQAWSLLPAAVRAAQPRLFVLGDGPLAGGLAAQAASLGIEDSVSFEGAVTDVARRLERMDLAVLCSDREGLSNAILEAMASGLPVVATEVGGNRELVDEKSGLLVPAGDAVALSAALATLICDGARRRRLGDNARARVAGEFAWEKAISDLTAWYEQLIVAARR